MPLDPLNHNDGVKSFYLDDGSKNLDGVWSGYDHAYWMTTVGRFWFGRLLDVMIETNRPDDRNGILHISGDAFGYGYTKPGRSWKTRVPPQRPALTEISQVSASAPCGNAGVAAIGNVLHRADCAGWITIDR